MVMTRYFGKNRSFREALPAAPFALFSALAFLVPYFITSRISPELPSIIGGLFSLALIILAAQKGFLAPKSSWEFDPKWQEDWGKPMEKTEDNQNVSLPLWQAWLPYILVAATLVATRLGIGKDALQAVTLSWENIFAVAGINYTMMPLWLPGFPFMVIALLSVFFYRMKFKQVTAAFDITFKRLLPAAIVLVFAVGLVRIMMNSGINLSGLESMLLVMSKFTANLVGGIWPLVSPFIGALGAFISGSNTVSNILFGGFQDSIASLLGISRIITAALQVVGGALGNMIAIYNVIAVATITGILGKEGKILRINLLPCFILTLLTGLLGLLFIYLIGVKIF